MEQYDRTFKGVWISKDLWINKNLTIQEKVMLVEIDSLETEEKGCYASNSYFADFFGVTPYRVSQILRNLNEKGYIDVDYIMENKQIKERNIHIKRPPYPPKEGCLENLKGGIKKNAMGYLENCKENNIYNNINNNTLVDLPSTKDNNFDYSWDNFELIWKEYPRKDGKANAYKSYLSWGKGKKFANKTIKLSNKQMWKATVKYAEYIVQNEIKPQFIKMGSTFFNSGIIDFVDFEE